MRILRGISLSFALALALIAYGGVASAESVTVTGGKLNVHAKVLPRHTIVVDEQGLIMQIFSNTAEDVDSPRVYKGEIDAANEQPITPALYDEYRRLVPAGKSRVGLLYERNPIIDLLQLPKFTLFPAQYSSPLSLR